MNQKNTYSRLVIFTFWLLLGGLLLGTVLFAVLEAVLWKLGYEAVVTKLLQILHQEDKREQFVSGYFTNRLFRQLMIFIPVVLALLVVVTFIYWRNRKWVLAVLSMFFQLWSGLLKLFVTPFIALSRSYKILLGATLFYILYTRIMISAGLPFHIDEMHSWLYFVDKGFLVSLSYYPSPNNHVFFSLLACVTDLFLDDPLWIMRVTSIGIGMVVSILVFRFLLSYVSFPFALLGMLLFSFTPVIQQYSVLGRGYMLETGLFIMAFWAFLKLIQSPSSVSFAFLFVVSSSLATFTLVTYLYALVGFGLIGLWYFSSWKLVRRWVFLYAVIASVVLMLYTPLMLFSGLSSITSNGWIIRPEWSEYLSRFGQMFQNHAEYFIAIPEWSTFIFVGLWIVLVLVLIRSEYQSLLFISLSLFAVGLIICILQRIVPYERMWTHLLFCQQLLVVLALYRLTRSWQSNRYINASIPGVFFMSQLLIGFIPKEKHPDIYDQSEVVSQKMLSYHPTSIFCQEYVYFNYLSVHARVNKQSVIIDNEGSSLNPDFIVHDKLLAWPDKIDKNHYFLWTECDAFVCIYRRKP